MSEHDHIRWLHGELRAWQRDGLLEPAQAKAIRVRYAAELEEGARTGLDRVVGAVSTLGGVLLGLGAILLVAANWEEIPAPWRVVLVVFAMVVLYAAGWRVVEGSSHRSVGRALQLGGTMMFGAGVFLVGQTYNVQAHDPLGFLVWAAAAGAMALVLGSVVHGVLMAFLLPFWWGFELGRLAERYVDGNEQGLALAVCGLVGALAMWAVGELLRTVSRSGRWSRVRVLAAPMRVAGFVAFAGFLLVPLSFLHRLTDEGARGGLIGPFAWVLVPASLVALCAVALLVRAPGRATSWLALGILTTGGLAAAPLLLASSFQASVVVNVAIVVLAFGAMVFGAVTRDRVAFALGVAITVAEVVLRYVDFLFDLLPGGVFFVSVGLLLLALGWLVGRSRDVWRQQGASG